ncbi:hypothetical protein IscW_ISCW024328 [Ixodes scapularis]|uniref:Uncharacterized protein n=1 Tax=Ixodes scapularis TaxID=6945 RepID=B7PNG7_IXOSC|nr:hypothetical protein IscW_ISCW024328 [Ixodes scapularis]|eukprot:XP_002435315.1 hypothetical protein IscW_ISCW024328 [Ixodes scapularis]
MRWRCGRNAKRTPGTSAALLCRSFISFLNVSSIWSARGTRDVCFCTNLLVAFEF